MILKLTSPKIKPRFFENMQIKINLYHFSFCMPHATSTHRHHLTLTLASWFDRYLIFCNSSSNVSTFPIFCRVKEFFQIIEELDAGS